MRVPGPCSRQLKPLAAGVFQPEIGSFRLCLAGHVVTGRGRLVVVVMMSGQIAQDERGELVGAGDPVAQARQVFENLRRCLAQAGAHFDDVVKLTFFVLDVADLAASAARDAVIDTTRPPASTAVQVAALFAPGYLLEGGGLGPGRRLIRAAHPIHINSDHARAAASRDRRLRHWRPARPCATSARGPDCGCQLSAA